MTMESVQECFDRLRSRIEGYRAENIEKRLRTLDLIDQGWSGGRQTAVTAKAEWMLSNHILHEVTEAARAGDRARVSLALALWNDLPQHPQSPVRSIDGRLDTLLGGLPENVTSIESDMPIFALTATVLDAARPSYKSLVRDSLGCVTSAGFGHYPDLALSLVVLLRPRPAGAEEYDNGTNEAFPCTIYTDYLDDPYLLAEDVLHETVHGWLNEAMAAQDIELPDTAEYYSPWKENRRTAYGIIHSGMAFSHVVMYLSRIASLEETPAFVKAYAQTRIADEAGRLREAEAGIRAAAGLMRCEELELILDAALAEATA